MTRQPAALLAALAALTAATACGSTVPPVPTAQLAGTRSNGLGGAAQAATTTGGSGAVGVPTDTGDRGTAPGPVAPGVTGVTPGASGVAPAPGAAAAPARASIPERGRGWDATVVRLGVTTEKDFSAAANNLGISSVDPGDQEGEARALAAELNRRGGLFGRKVEIVFRDHRTADLQTNPAGQAQATCTFFTQDQAVIAVINPVSLLDTPTFRGCMAKARVPVFALSVQAYDSKVLQEYSPYYYSSVAPPYDRLAPVLVERLKAQGFFGGWDPLRGAPGSLPVKIGVIVVDDEVGHRVAAIMRKALTAAGLPEPEVFQYRTSNEYSNAVLQFRNDGVTHVLGTDARMLVFLQTADSQNYRPRYGISSYWAPNAFLEETAPDRQLVGSMGVGFGPSLDVSAARDAEDMPGEAVCRAVLAKGGQHFEGKRFAEAVGYALCDAFLLLATAATHGGGFLGPQLAAGLQSAGPAFRPAFAFRSGLGQGSLFVPGAVRDLRYDEPCRCYRYGDRRNRLL